MNARHRLSLVAAILLAALAPWLARALEVPYLSGRVNDTANLMSAEEERAVEEKLRSFEEETGAQVVVLTLPSLEGEVLEDFTLRVAETWKLGREGVDDGVLLLVARDDRKLRIEVGYGLEPVLTDLEAHGIVDRVIVPRFREGRFGEGIDAGVSAILGTIRGEEVIPPEAQASQGIQEAPPVARIAFLAIFSVVILPFAFSALFGRGCQGWFLWVFLMPFLFFFPQVIFGTRIAWGILGAWVIGYPLAKLWLGQSPSGKRFLGRHPGWTTWASSGGRGGSSGGGFSGGGFSGGGGSFGGGGASGSW